MLHPTIAPARAGLDRAAMRELIGASALASPLIGYKLDALGWQDNAPAFEARMMGKDFDLILAAAHATQTPMPLTLPAREGWSALCAKGNSKADFFKYVELAARRAGIGECRARGLARSKREWPPWR